MAYILRSILCIGVVYAMSPVSTRGPESPGTGVTTAAAARTERTSAPGAPLDATRIQEIAALGAEAGRVLASADPQTRRKLMEILAEHAGLAPTPARATGGDPPR